MDLRVKRTERNIEKAFLELRKNTPLEKITVKKLAERAEINKATFYAHYNDIYDLSEKLEDKYIREIMKNVLKQIVFFLIPNR